MSFSLESRNLISCAITSLKAKKLSEVGNWATMTASEKKELSSKSFYTKEENELMRINELQRIYSFGQSSN